MASGWFLFVCSHVFLLVLSVSVVMCCASAKCIFLFQVSYGSHRRQPRPAPPVQVMVSHPDIEDEDNDSKPSDEDSSDLPSTSPSNKKAVLALHTRLAEVFPASFHVKDPALPYWESTSEPPFPLLCIDPDNEGTWIMPPLTHPDDSYGYWKSEEKIRLPPSKTSLMPHGSARKTHKRPTFFHFADENLKDLFEAPPRDKVFLSPAVFDRTYVSVKSSSHALLDTHLRTSLLEQYTVDAYMRLFMDLSNCAAGFSSSVSPSEAVSLLPEVARQAALANARLGQSLTAAYVGNTVALRDFVLNGFSVPGQTLDYLRGGDFGTKSLFGPLPEHFSTLLESSNRADLRCKSVFTRPSPASTTPAATSSVSQKRPAPARGYPRAKRTPPPAPRPSRGRGKRFQRGPASRRSRLGRS